jgi:hypothetical protein
LQYVDLLDAVAGHRAAGLSEPEAVARALDEFGRPEQVRSELEATHGHRVMAVVIDKALQWKERTMRAKWLWATGAHLGLSLVIALEALFITFLVMFIVPKFKKLMGDGIVDPAVLEEQGAMWMPSFLGHLATVTGHYTTYIVFGAVVVWGLFEWRVRGENKSLMRLSALGTVATVLAAVVIVATGSMLVSMMLAMPAMGQMARPFAVEQVTTIDTSAAAIEQAVAKKDWPTALEQTERTSSALHRLSSGPALTSLKMSNEPPTAADLRAQTKSAHEHLRAVRQAVAEKEADRADGALGEFRKAFGPVREASKRPVR